MSIRWLVPIPAAISLRLRSTIPLVRACSTAASSSRSLACETVTPQCTIWFMNHMVQRKGRSPMRQLYVEAEGVTRADPEVVWSLVADANSYPSWGPWNDGGYQPAHEGPSRKGSVQWFRYGRRTTTVEEILEADEPRRLVYTIVRGIPVRNYRAEVTLTPTAPGG